MTLSRTWTLVALATLAACSGEPVVEEAETVDEPAEAAAAANPAEPEISPDQLKSSAENIALVPSPVETQKALEAAGIDTKLSELVDQTREYDLDSKDKDNVAVRTGVVLADMLLTVKTAEKEVLLDRLEKLHAGMDQLGAGSDILRMLKDYRERVKGDAIARDELLRELDELSGAVIPELEFNGQERIVPLIQAGSWLEGANLVARAVKGKGQPAAADSLLKQPAVVKYFIGYVKTEGQDKAPAAVTQKLETALTTLQGLAEKSEPMTEEDIDTVIQTTNDVLALL